MSDERQISEKDQVLINHMMGAPKTPAIQLEDVFQQILSELKKQTELLEQINKNTIR